MASFINGKFDGVVSSSPASSAQPLFRECPICFDELYKHTIAYLITDSGRRVCNHYFHENCLLDWRSFRNTCPIDRRVFNSIIPIPSPFLNPLEWFRCVDSDGDGFLDKREVINILQAQLPVDSTRLEQEADSLWALWDINGDGKLSFEELTNSESGLIYYVRHNFPSPVVEVPSLNRHNLSVWFDYWDEDKSGTLDKWEVTRALAKTFTYHNSESLASIRRFKETVDALWCVFDYDGNGTMDITEFCQADGLGESVCASLIHQSSLSS